MKLINSDRHAKVVCVAEGNMNDSTAKPDIELYING